MKFFEKPIAELIVFAVEDVITTSTPTETEPEIEGGENDLPVL